MDKGTRVKIVKGRTGKDQTGTVFWEGPNKWGEGTRLGIEGDDGETYWVASENVEAVGAGADAGPPPADEFERGQRVRFKNRGNEGKGTIFWIGESKSGGRRVGLNPDEDAEEALWLNARQCTALDPSEDDGPPPREQRAAPQSDEPRQTWHDKQDGDDDAEAPPPDMGYGAAPPPADDAPPWDDADVPVGGDDEEIPF